MCPGPAYLYARRARPLLSNDQVYGPDNLNARSDTARCGSVQRLAAAAFKPPSGALYSCALLRQKVRLLRFSVLEGYGLRAPYVDTLIAKLDARAEGGHPAIVFIGTPSLLQPEQMTRILDVMYRNFPLARDAEISCEANPSASPSLSGSSSKRRRQPAFPGRAEC